MALQTLSPKKRKPKVQYRASGGGSTATTAYNIANLDAQQQALEDGTLLENGSGEGGDSGVDDGMSGQLLATGNTSNPYAATSGQGNYVVNVPGAGAGWTQDISAGKNGTTQITSPTYSQPDSWSKFLTVAGIAAAPILGGLSAAGEFGDAGLAADAGADTTVAAGDPEGLSSYGLTGGSDGLDASSGLASDPGYGATIEDTPGAGISDAPGMDGINNPQLISPSAADPTSFMPSDSSLSGGSLLDKAGTYFSSPGNILSAVKTGLGLVGALSSLTGNKNGANSKTSSQLAAGQTGNAASANFSPAQQALATSVFSPGRFSRTQNAVPADLSTSLMAPSGGGSTNWFNYQADGGSAAPTAATSALMNELLGSSGVVGQNDAAEERLNNLANTTLAHGGRVEHRAAGGFMGAPGIGGGGGLMSGGMNGMQHSWAPPSTGGLMARPGNPAPMAQNPNPLGGMQVHGGPMQRPGVAQPAGGTGPVSGFQPQIGALGSLGSQPVSPRMMASGGHASANAIDLNSGIPTGAAQNFQAADALHPALQAMKALPASGAGGPMNAASVLQAASAMGLGSNPNIQKMMLMMRGIPSVGQKAGGPSGFGPRVQGLMTGGAGGQDDNIPTMLSPGEYVMDADTVSSLGDGNNAAGAKSLDQMREALRAHKRSAPDTKIPPKSRPALSYLPKKGAK